MDLQGKLDCEHRFCFSCIDGWSKTTNTCPLCKREFFRILKQSSKGLLIEEVIVQPKQVNLEELLEEPQANFDDADDYCYACVSTEREDDMLVCDKCNKKCCHIQCLHPPLEEIPYEPWYCDFCVRDHGLRQLLPTANLFQRQEPNQRRNRLRRAPVARNLNSNAGSLSSRGQSIARSNRSNDNQNIINRNVGANRNQTQGNRFPNIGSLRLQTVNGPPSRSPSENINNGNGNPRQFVFNPNFQHQPRARRPARRPRNQRSRQSQARSRRSPPRGNANPQPARNNRFQFQNRNNAGRIGQNYIMTRMDLEAFDEEFRANPNQNREARARNNSNARGPARPSENYF